MENEAYNEALIERYLLGELPDDEQIRLEDRAFSDHQYLQNVLAVENDLIDDYLRGSLPERKQRQFETRFLASDERRQKVEFARALAKVATKSAAAEPVRQPVSALAPASWWDSFVDLLRAANPAAKLSLAAASLALIIGIPWLVAQTIKLRGEINRLQAEQQARQKDLEQQVAGARTRSEELTGQLQREKAQRERSEELAHQLEQEREKLLSAQKDQSAPTTTIASLILLPGISRGGGNRLQLVIPPPVRLARLQIGLEREDEYQSFRVEIRTAQGQEVWTQDRLRPRTSGAGRVVKLVVPGSAFDAGQYELTLKGVIDQQKTEDVRYYYFDVLKR
jgi:hypothetical protein